MTLIILSYSGIVTVVGYLAVCFHTKSLPSLCSDTFFEIYFKPRIVVMQAGEHVTPRG